MLVWFCVFLLIPTNLTPACCGPFPHIVDDALLHQSAMVSQQVAASILLVLRFSTTITSRKNTNGHHYPPVFKHVQIMSNNKPLQELVVLTHPNNIFHSTVPISNIKDVNR